MHRPSPSSRPPPQLALGVIFDALDIALCVVVLNTYLAFVAFLNERLANAPPAVTLVSAAPGGQVVYGGVQARARGWAMGEQGNDGCSPL